MKQSIFILLFFALGCQDYNSNTFDESRYGGAEITGSADFKASYVILKNRCMNCHDHAHWAKFTIEADWINNGQVVAGDPDNSPVIFRLKNRGSDMPQDGQPLPQVEYDQLVNWIEAL